MIVGASIKNENLRDLTFVTLTVTVPIHRDLSNTDDETQKWDF